MWAAAKLGLRLRAAWWETLAAPLLAATAATTATAAAESGNGRRSGGGGGDGGAGAGAVRRGAAGVISASGRDLCNALYALGLAAAAAGEEGGAAARFRGWLAALGGRLLRGCNAERLRVGEGVYMCDMCMTKVNIMHVLRGLHGVACMWNLPYACRSMCMRCE